MTTKKYFILPGLAALAITLTAASAFAAEGDQTERPERELPENHEEIVAAIEAGDYDTWYELVSENDDERAEKLLEVITEDNFDEFSEAHSLLQEAHELELEAKEMFEEIGLEHIGGPKGQHGKRGGQFGGPRGGQPDSAETQE